ncbi:MAG: polysaccharide deacetylase family protein [Planctomycetes bacterium]|nr:polysaccharide deacetylase family protein [Planctomycetota bacterium]
MIKAIFIKVVAIAGIAASLRFGQGADGWIAAGVIFTLTLAWISWGVFNVNSSLWADTVWRAPEPVKAVALTFDDGPDARFTQQILEVLADKGVKACFFSVGSRVIDNPDITHAIHQQGHMLGNHSESHAMWINFSLHKRLRREVRDTNAAIKQAAGVVPRFYRAPHGFKNPALGDILAQEGMLAVGWQVRGFDAVSGNAAKIAERVVDGAKGGGVILLHDGAGLQGSDDRSATVDALPVIIDGLRAKGLEIVRLDELLKIDAYLKSEEAA